MDNEGSNPSTASEIEAKYVFERDKRLQARPEGEAQFSVLTNLERFKHFESDPWVGPLENTAIPSTIDVKSPIKYLIVGAGYSGLLFAVRLLERGIKLEELVIIDSAGGYGGVWYWNRYPGLMCDLESYIYMPLLEETGYMPRHKYSYGPELRAHANRIAQKWNLAGRTIFRREVKEMHWDENKWVVNARFVGEDRHLDVKLHVGFVILAGGQVTIPKAPNIEGLDTFQGHVFHTSRWDHQYTGGSPDDAAPKMTNLEDKVVTIVGTGATAIQVIPELAKYAKHLFVVQRTPSSVDIRNQKETDPEEWKRITSNNGWWMDRNINFAKIVHQTQPQPTENLVSDYWVLGNPSYCTAWGYDNVVRPDGVEELIKRMHAGDLPRAERIRKRVDEIVRDSKTARELKHWYPTWCKRPCFHDDYLSSYNQPNVTLLDTDGQGIEKFTNNGFVVNGNHYESDAVILATGYKVLGGSTNSSAAFRFGIKITGKDGIDMEQMFEKEVKTLHGLCCAGFPNLFFTGAAQTSLTANQIMGMDIFARHVAYIITEAQRVSETSQVIVEPTEAAQIDWGDQVAKVALGTSGMAGCTPNYFNLEGQLDKALSQSPEKQEQARRSQLWGRGIIHYTSVLSEWKHEGNMKGFVIKSLD